MFGINLRSVCETMTAAFLSVVTMASAQFLPQLLPRVVPFRAARGVSPVIPTARGTQGINPQGINAYYPQRGACVVGNFRMQPNLDIRSFMGQW